MLKHSSSSGIYVSRLIVPVDLRPLVGRREIRKSLQCADYRRAKVRGAAWEGHLANLLAKVRRNHSNMTSSQIDALVHYYLTTTLAANGWRLFSANPRSGSGESSRFAL